uniref:E3 ubiquitin-protein ligase TM129 n=1 Tax=Timema tahoe TaxID=61484 RepID=A0A7R9IP66_9NEOP|nr:unnamed protein product [Timema tahoe]
MFDSTLIYTIFYILVATCFVYPPNEFVSAGFTVQCLFSSWLGSETENFIQYHIRRTVATILSHSFLGLGYLLGVCCINHNDRLSVWMGSPAWNMFVVVSLLLPVCAGILVMSWWKDRWKFHPIARTLSAFCSQNNPPSWVLVAAEINIEFRSSCDNHSVSPSGPGGAQFLNIEVKSFVPNTKSFNIRLNALDFKDLQDKVNRPINVLQNITFHRTLTDRFLDAFKEQVVQNVLHETSQCDNNNTKINLPQSHDIVCLKVPELCIGCMAATSNVKLVKLCVSDNSVGDDPCTRCNCRPMWCIDCMAKFASRQDQAHPETWLGSKCTCPMCRSRFCVLDVCQLRPFNTS